MEVEGRANFQFGEAKESWKLDTASSLEILNIS